MFIIDTVYKDREVLQPITIQVYAAAVVQEIDVLVSVCREGVPEQRVVAAGLHGNAVAAVVSYGVAVAGRTTDDVAGGCGVYEDAATAVFLAFPADDVAFDNVSAVVFQENPVVAKAVNRQAPNQARA